MKRKLTTILCAALVGGMFLTGCMKNEESESVRNIRDGYANLLAQNAEWVKAKAALEAANAAKQVILNRIEEVNAKLKEGTYDATLASQLAYLQAELAKNETSYYTNLLAKAKAEAAYLVGEQLVEYNEYYNQLFSDPNYVSQRSTVIGELSTARQAVADAFGSTKVEQKFILQRDSAMAANNVERVEALIGTYGDMEGATSDELAKLADEALVNWTALQVVEDEAEKAEKVAEQAKDNAGKLYLDYKDQIFGSTVYTYEGTDPMAKASGNVASAATFSVSGLNAAVNFAKARTAYLNNEDLTYTGFTNGYGIANTGGQVSSYTNAPDATNPNMAYIKDKQVQTDRNLVEVNNNIEKVATPKRDAEKKIFDDNKANWATANTAYYTAAVGTGATLNARAAALRGTPPAAAPTSATIPNNLAEYKAMADLSLTPSTVSATYVENTRQYLLARLQFDMPTLVTGINSLTTAAGVTNVADPGSYDKLVTFLNSSSSFTACVAANLSDYNYTALNDKADLLLKDAYNTGYLASNPQTGASASSLTFRTVPSFNYYDVPAAIPAADRDYFTKTIAGKLLLYSAQIYGADGIADVKHFPLESEPAAGVVSQLSNYSKSFFGIYWDAEDALKTAKNALVNLEKDKVDFAALAVACQKSIDAMAAFLAKYEPMLAEAQTKLEEQAPVYEAALLPYIEAQVAYVDAQKKATDAKALYDLLVDGSGNVIDAISARLRNLTTSVKGYHTDLAGANKALETYRLGIFDIQYKQEQVEILVQKLAELDKVIAALQAKMAAVVATL